MDRFDAVVVGGGAAGLGAAYRMAENGLNVLLIERGENVGEKSVYGGRIYSWVFEKYVKGFQDAPIERWVKKERLTFLDEKESVSIEYSSDDTCSFVAILTKFNRWLAEKVEDAGGLVVSGIKVEDVKLNPSRVVADGEEIECDAVVIAEGINPMLAMRLGIRRDWKPEEVAVGVKEVFKLSESEINSRFDVESDEGVANLFVGYPIFTHGGGFIYTNRDTISVGMVVRVDSAMKNKIEVYDLAEKFRAHKDVAGFLKGGSMIEYSAHLVPEAGIKGVPDSLHKENVMIVGDTAGFVLNRGFTIRGVDFAFYSGVLAADSIREAMDKGDASHAGQIYERKVRESVIVKELEKFRKALDVLENTRFFDDYTRMMVQIMRGIFDVKEESNRLYDVVMDKTRGRKLRMTLDFLSAFRGL